MRPLHLLVGGNGRALALLELARPANSLKVLASVPVPDDAPAPSWIHLAPPFLICNSEIVDGRIRVYDAAALLENPSPDADAFVRSTAPAALRLDILSRGAHPCYMQSSLDASVLFAANYTGGTVLFYSLNPERPFNHIIDFNALAGEGIDSHPHMAIMNPFEVRSSGHVYIPDLGADRLYVATFDSQTGTPVVKTSLQLPKGSGPRHICFHPNGTHAYVNLELSSEMAVITLYPELAILSTHTLLTPELAGQIPRMQSAAIALSGDARFIYASNRHAVSRNDTIVRYALAPTGLVDTNVSPEWTHTRGAVARGMDLLSVSQGSDADSKEDRELIAVGNQESDSVVVFERNTRDGTLEFVSDVSLPVDFKPTCVVWM
ncbi:hypothetical protein HDU83_007129 [Entophlyctis luteolus]|nr:hypothetical protein HDU83_007129 [Entophlyctis luteolus]